MQAGTLDAHLPKALQMPCLLRLVCHARVIYQKFAGLYALRRCTRGGDTVAARMRVRTTSGQRDILVP
jgi:hypothetical protein